MRIRLAPVRRLAPWVPTRLVLAPLCLALLGANNVSVPDPGEFLQKQLGDAVSDVRILEVGTRGVFVYGRATTNDGAELGTYCREATEALELVLPGRSAHVLWHTPSGVDHKCPAPGTRRKLPPPPGEETGQSG
jgi:hypothetical protein